MSEISSSQLNEIWLTAMDSLVQSRLSGLSYDKTNKCVIKQNKGNGIYLVEQDNNTKFDAIAQNQMEYNINEEVYVLIPRGDYSTSKIIIGRANLDSSSLIVNYIDPLSTVVPTANLAIDTTYNTYGIQANGNKYNPQLKLLYTIDLVNSKYKYNYIYDTLGIDINIKTLFAAKSMTCGNYGILLRLIMEDDSVYDALFDSSEMFGDPYNYMTYFKQSKLFNLSQHTKSIAYIGVYLYEQGNFKYHDTVAEVSYAPKTLSSGEPVDDILINNINIILGNNVIPIADNTLFLTVLDEETRKNTYAGNETKEIKSTWYNKTEDNELIGFSDGVVDAQYDEKQYQQILTEEWGGALIASTDGIAPLKESLQLFYNSSVLQQTLDALYNYAGGDIASVINDLNNYLSKFDCDTNALVAEVLSTYQNYLIQFSNRHETLPGWKTLYLNYLNDVYFNYEILANQSENSLKPLQWSEDILIQFNLLQNQWQTLKNAVDSWFNDLTTLSTGRDLYGDIKAYSERQKRIFIQLIEIHDSLYTKMSEILMNSVTQKDKLELRLSQTDIVTFTEQYNQFIKDNCNKYCIYWYRYCLNQKNDGIGGQDWQLIEDWPSGVPGMPSISSDGLCYNTQSDITAKIQLNENVKEERIKAILFFNHIAYESNVLTFINDTPPSDAAQPEPQDSIAINHGKNSTNSFQKYTSTFSLINSSESVIERELYVTYNSIDINVTSDAALKNTTVYWYIPKQNTMLNYNGEYLRQLGFTQLSILLKSLMDNQEDYDFYSKYQRQGFECFFKNIQTNDDNKFYYLIQNFYQHSAVLNSIYCVVEKEEQNYETRIDFIFSTYGSSGTQYTLSITPIGTKTAIGMDALSPLYVEVNFTGFEGAKIENPPAIDLTWLIGGENPTWAPAIVSLTTEEALGVGINIREGAKYYALNRTVNFSQCLYNVLVAQAKWSNINDTTLADSTLTLKTYYPIAQSVLSCYLDGPTSVIYDTNGTNPSYISKNYKLYYTNNNVEITDLIWTIQHYTKDGQIADIANVGQYLPKLHYQEEPSPAYTEPGYYLRPLQMYVQNVDIYSVIIASRKDGTPIFAQPIYIGQNQWGSGLLNAWNEKLTIDEENGIILSSMIGAGFKDTENRFNGILMGDVGGTARMGDIGLYGFHEGAESYGFDVRGKAFLGKSGSGRICFDGNTGQIQSSTFASNAGNCGMRIDLDDGKLEIKGSSITTIGDKKTYDSDGTQSSLTLQSTSPYLNIKDKDNITLMNVGSDSFYLQTADYDADGTAVTGVRLDLKNGALKAGDFKISAGDRDANFIIIDSNKEGQYPLRIGSEGTPKFQVAWDGTLKATDGQFTGDITGGTIKIGSKFKVDRDGTLTATNGKFTGDITGGSINIGNGNFKVDNGGNLSATGAAISANNITAASGTIGGFTFDGSGIASSSLSMNASGACTAKSMSVSSAFDCTLLKASRICGKSDNPPYIYLDSTASSTQAVTAKIVTSNINKGTDGFFGAGGDHGSITITVQTNVPLKVAKTFKVVVNYKWTFSSDHVEGKAIRTHNVSIPAGSSSGSFTEVYRYNFSGNNIYEGCELSPTSYTESSPGSSAAIEISGHLVPIANGSYNLGSSAKEWNNIYVETAYYLNGTGIDLSDGRKKFDIEPLNENYSDLFDKLTPVSFKYVNGNSHRTHTGFIAQDVKDAAIASNLNINDFAIYCEWENESTKEQLCGLRYEEFIPICVSEIQKLKERIKILESEKGEQ